jgi:hypothetical protein
MASYLDYLFPAQQEQAIPGLLSEEDALKNKQAAQTSGLLNMGLGIIAASAPSRMPQGSILQPIATGIMAGQQAYQGASEQQMKNIVARKKLMEEESVILPEGGTLVGKRTGNVLSKGAGKLPAEYTNALAFLGLPTDIRPEDLSTEQLNALNQKMIQAKAASAPKSYVNTSDPTAVAKAGMDVTKQYTDLTKEARERASRWNAIVSASKDPMNPATDATLIYSTAKILDPTGAVQQGDLKTIIGNRSIPQEVQALANKLDRGGSLSQSERDNLVSNAYGIVKADQKNIEPIVGNFKDYANTFKVDPAKIESPYKDLQKPDKIMIPFGGKRVAAKLADDGFYYVKSGDKYYKVNE